MSENKDDKVVVKLKKEYLSSEREVNKYKTLSILFGIALIACIVIISLYITSNILINKDYNDSSDKAAEIKNIIRDNWVFGNDYEDLDLMLDDQMYRGLTTFDNDPYTVYMSSDDMDYFSNSIDKIQLGIGVSYYKEYNGYPYVLEVYKNSGAFNGGIKKGDRIVTIGEHDVLGCDDEQIKEYVLGDEGTFVEVTVDRNGSLMTFNCERKYFDSTAHAELYGDVVVLTLSSFGTNTAQTASEELKDYTNYHKLIIDLRNNTGGYQDSLLKVAALFLENDTLVMKEIDCNGEESNYYANYNDHYYNFDDIVIITNENTASAAEVFSICMKEQHNNTTLVGKETYGKGVVQTSYKLSDGSYLKVTIAYWTSPNGVSLLEGGIVPDIELFLDDVFYVTKYAFDNDVSYTYDSVSARISFVELILKYLGYPVTRTDGYFDEGLINALNMYKIDIGLTADGILDKTTYEKLYDSLNISDKDEILSAALDIINK